MGTKGSMLLCILLLSSLLIPTEVSARPMLHNSHAAQLEASHQVDGENFKPIGHNPLNPNKPVGGRGPGQPYTRPCRNVYNCSRGPPGP